MTNPRARLVLDAPLNEAAEPLLDPATMREIGAEVLAVYQNLLIAKGLGAKFDTQKSVHTTHIHDAGGGACMHCRDHAIDGLATY